ncbi:DUF4019 domain-containing protein [uncultured Ramlibacter sp.]|uniref:DUF4019 domain-containing protein n=1 Tax=uncultured Ramlibacter sp. TaxID=260755 RepID=UPI00262A85E2|nr:DUF4019 domain-containing protein [uncultured Ramlibacter sp.]
MTASRTLTLAAALFCTAAGAQLKLPKNAPAAPSAPAAAPAQSGAQAPAPVSSEQAAKEAAGKLVAAAWLTLLDRRDWGTAWESTAAMFRSTVPLAMWMDNIPNVRTPLGVFVERQTGPASYKTTLEGRPAGDYVSVVFLTKFDKKEVQEIVTTVREADGKWRVTGYSTR